MPKKKWKNAAAGDPITRFKHVLQTAYGFSADASSLEKDAAKAIDDAEEYARNSPLPDPTTAMEYIYA